MGTLLLGSRVPPCSVAQLLRSRCGPPPGGGELPCAVHLSTRLRRHQAEQAGRENPAPPHRGPPPSVAGVCGDQLPLPYLWITPLVCACDLEPGDIRTACTWRLHYGARPGNKGRGPVSQVPPGAPCLLLGSTDRKTRAPVQKGRSLLPSLMAVRIRQACGSPSAPPDNG